MTDIMFAKVHMGEYFQLDGRKVRVIGYDASGAGDCIIVDDMKGWDIRYIYPTDKFRVASDTGRCTYTKWENLKS